MWTSSMNMILNFVAHSMMVIIMATSTFGHFRLTYPKARQPDMDFKDFRTTGKYGPCGVAAGAPRTTLKAGSRLNVTWHLAYPHQGGFQITILPHNDKPKQWLTSEKQWFGAEVATVQYHVVDLPQGYSCKGCTIRVQRQALEWGAKYFFYSCADVNILDDAEFTTFQESNENYCFRHGSVGSGDSCSCEKTYSGKYCQYKDDCVDDQDCNGNGKCIDTEGTSHPRFQCFCDSRHFGRYCENENPADFTKDFETDEYTSRELSNEYHLYYRILKDSEELEVVMSVTSTTWAGIGWRPKELTVECQDFPALDGSFVPPKEGDNMRKKRAAPSHPMDCTDVIIGRARGDYGKVTDHYTRDRSTPLFDEDLHGEQSLTAATAYEMGSETIIKFRRLLSSPAKEKTDYTISNADMHIIWARGQEPGNYKHSPASGIEKGNGDTDFYKQDEVKYHGKGIPRGVETLNFFGEQGQGIDYSKSKDICSYGSYKSPSTCKEEDCVYRASWEYNGVTQDLSFTVTAKQAQDKWTGIGFAPERKMENVDVILGYVDDSGKPQLTDNSINSRYTAPVLDQDPKLKEQEIKYKDGAYDLSFARARRETFQHDCFYFIYPVGGGSYTNGQVQKHDSTPVISAEKICVEQCVPGYGIVTDDPEEGKQGKANFLAYNTGGLICSLMIYLASAW